jgi:hypothetical protein
MSEYQYYEWQIIDRPLSAREQAEVSRHSSHMDTVTYTQAIVIEFGPIWIWNQIG